VGKRQYFIRFWSATKLSVHVWCQHEWDKTGLKVKRYFQSNNG